VAKVIDRRAALGSFFVAGAVLAVPAAAAAATADIPDLRLFELIAEGGSGEENCGFCRVEDFGAGFEQRHQSGNRSLGTRRRAASADRTSWGSPGAALSPHDRRPRRRNR
jgi:hypothetical protein